MSALKEENKCEKPNWFQKLGIWCSGASCEAIKECSNDWNKLAFNGHIILLTAIFAFLSGSYFLSYVFPEQSWVIPILFGFIWATLIFTLDRIIIVSMRKNGNVWQQLIHGGIWRIILAVFIGLVVATPIELRLFKPEIMEQVRLNRLKDNTAKALEKVKNDSIQRANYIEAVNSYRISYNLDELEKKEKELRQFYYTLDKQRIEEAEGTGGTGKRGKGPVYEEKLKSFDIAKTNWEESDKELREANRKYNEAISNIPQITHIEESFASDDSNKKDVTNYGVEESVKALYQLSGLHWFITLLFILIECLPVITKLMTPRGSYDEALDRIEYEKMIEQKKIISQKNSEINELLRRADEAAKLSGDVMIQKTKDKLETELKNNKIILDTIANYQQELALLAIEKWREEEFAKINQDKFD